MNEFKGYWSALDKELWAKTDWKARDYKDLPVEDTITKRQAYFYSMNDKTHKANAAEKLLVIDFQKYIRSNPIYSPYYGPVYTSELLTYMNDNAYCYPSFNGDTEDGYPVHDRFESAEIADILSR